MFFITIFTALMFNFTTISNSEKSNSDNNYFKKLEHSTHKDQLLPGHKFTYSKVPTKLIKIDKNSN